ncbi:MAG: monooxygenase, FAD-binding [Ramlibacter sp.]|nr:monooxygenase, FAD-binding [Ramlibacter sp.]
MNKQALIVGGGIGGLAAALTCSRAGWSARLYEKAQQFSEVGAGIQLGPNATRILAHWGLESALASVAAFPGRLIVRAAQDGSQLGTLRLGSAFTERYGAPYAAVHRADLQDLLLDAVRNAGVDVQLSAAVGTVLSFPHAARLRIDGREIEGDALVGADGLWSAVRSQVFSDGPPVFAGHLAYRSLAIQRDLPEPLRSRDVTVWLGPRMHLVSYPVKRGEQLNVVVLVQGAARAAAAQEWDQAAAAAELQIAMGPLCAPLQDLVQAMPGWRLWALHDRPPMRGADEMARGRVALLGDAAHPMLPYFAQGAGMALEDAEELGRTLSMGEGDDDAPLALRRYAQSRWQRCARVQALSRRNGHIFHATGPLRWGRDLSLRLLGERLLDQPWLYVASGKR